MNGEPTPTQSDIAAPLVQLAAALRRFDPELFNHVAGDPGAFDWLNAHAPLRPAGPDLCLPDATQRAALRLLQRTAPLAEIERLGATLSYLRGLLAGCPADRRAEQERRYFFYFDLLLVLLMQRYDWERIGQELQCAEALAGSARARHLIAMYQGYAEVHTERVAPGRARLDALLGTPALDPDVQARTLLGIAQSHWYETRFDLAIQVGERLLALARDTGQPLYEGLALVNMVSAYTELEQYDRAHDLSARSLAIFQALDEPVRAAHACYRIGISAFHLGRWEEARVRFAEAIAQFQALNLQNGLALLYYADGVLALMQGNPAQSEASLRQVIAVAERPGNAELALANDAYFQLGLLYQTEGRADDAIAAYRRARDLADRHQRTFLIGQIEYRWGRVLQGRGDREEALARYQAAITVSEALFQATDAAEFKLGLLATTPQMYEAIVLLLLDLGRPREAFEYVERARSRAFLDQLSRQSPELFATFSEPVATLDEVQSCLSERGALIEYYAIGVLPHDPGMVGQLGAEQRHVRDQLAFPPQVWAFVLTRAGLHAERLPVDPNQLRPNPSLAGPARQFLRERLLTHLYAALVAPYAERIAGCDQIYLIPHGPLHYIPFLALRGRDGASLLRPNGPPVAFAPSATVLVRGCLQPPRRDQGEFLSLGYNDQGSLALDYAEVEAALVAQRMQGRALTGDQPKSAALRAAAPNLRGLHIAGHAFFFPDDPLSSMIHLGADDRLSARAIIDTLRLGADLVVLSACTSGLARVVTGDELFGLQRALIAAGARTVVCTLWEASDLVTLILISRFYESLGRGDPPARALCDAQLALRTMTGRALQQMVERWRAEDPILARAALLLPEVPAAQLDELLYADPYHWAPFMVIGRAS